MKGLRFTWDPAKAAANRAKHGVDFAEAIHVFGDPFAITIPDPDHGGERELREITIGASGKMRILVVSHAERDGTLRIISARTATRGEISTYQDQ